MTTTAPLIPPLLRNGIRLLVYNGDEDLICNYLGEYCSSTLCMQKKSNTWRNTVDHGPVHTVSVYAVYVRRVDRPVHCIHTTLPRYATAYHVPHSCSSCVQYCVAWEGIWRIVVW